MHAGGSLPAGWIPATRALAEARAAGLGSRVKGIRPIGEELTLVLRRGTEIRVGRATEVGLKLTVAARVLWLVDGSVERVAVLDAACDRVGRDPATVWRSLGLYTLCGENETDLVRRFERMVAEAPPGVVRGDLDAYRAGRLVGTVDEVREQAATWESLGVDTLIAGVGAVPFHVTSRDDVALLGHALGG